MHATVGIMYAFVWAYYYYVINYRNTMCIIFRGCDCPVIETRNHSGRDESVQKLQISKKILRYSKVWNDLHKDSHAFEAARVSFVCYTVSFDDGKVVELVISMSSLLKGAVVRSRITKRLLLHLMNYTYLALGIKRGKLYYVRFLIIITRAVD